MTTTLELYTRSGRSRFAHRELSDEEAVPTVGAEIDLFDGNHAWSDAPKARVAEISFSQHGTVVRLDVDALDHEVEQVGPLSGWQRHRRAVQRWEADLENRSEP